MNWTKLRQKLFYLPSEISKIKEDALIDAQCELEDRFEKLEQDEEAFELTKEAHNKQIFDKIARLNIYINPQTKYKEVVLRYADQWDCYMNQQAVYKHIANQLAKRMESEAPF
jgi:adenosine deaminase